LTLRPQDLADLVQQRLDVVTDAALAELSERGEIAPDLRRIDVRVLRDLLRGDALLSHLARLRQHLEVPREAGCDADREPIRHTSSLLDLVTTAAVVAATNRLPLVQPHGGKHRVGRGT